MKNPLKYPNDEWSNKKTIEKTQKNLRSKQEKILLLKQKKINVKHEVYNFCLS